MIEVKQPSRSKLAVLFWFYKDVIVCRNHLELFRQTNTDTVIYGLYGGLPDQETEFRTALDPLLADFYTCPEPEPERKWRHGDLMITDWYRQRGQHLDWKSLFILQWDALVFTNLDQFFSDRRPDQLFLSGYQPITPNWETNWHWTRADNQAEHELYKTFQEHLRVRYPAETNDNDCWHLCLFIFEILTRDFLEQYATISQPELGFLEYKIATYAHIWGFSVYKKEVGLFGELKNTSTAERPVNAVGQQINTNLVRDNIATSSGWRLFHPYFDVWPPNP